MRKLVAAVVFVLLVSGGVWVVLALFGTQPPRVLLIGVDGADWDILDPLIEQGRLPHLARLREEGVSGALQTLADIPLSPVIWTSVATGKGPAKHGITWFLVDTPDGERIPVRSYNRKVKALWNLVSDSEGTPGVVGWWATAPVEEVGDGVVVSDAIGFHGFGRTGRGLPDAEKVYPAELHDDLAVLVPPLQQVDYGLGQRFFHLSAEEYYRLAFAPGRYVRSDPTNPIHLFQESTATTLGYTAITRRLLGERDFDLFLVYYESSDSISHLFMKYAPPRLPWVEEEEFERYCDVVDRYYEFIDEQIGALLATVSEDWTVVVVSDHGFRTGEDRPRSTGTVDIRGAHLDHDPEGILVARGPQLRRGARLEGASVLDVAPTLLHLLGLPVGSDMDGRVLGDAFREGFLDEHPIQYVETYEDPEGRPGAPATAEGEDPIELDEAMARLRMLGYVGDEAPPPGDGATGPAEEMTSPEQHNNLGRVHLQSGDLEAAMREFQRALEAAPGNGEALINIGLVHLARGQQDLALRSFMQALEANPNDVGAILRIAELRQERGELPLAEAMYRQALAIDDRLPGPYLGLGDVLNRQGRHREAEQLFRKAIELDPKLPEAHYDLAVALMALGETDDAKPSLRKAIELAPEFASALNNLGHLLLNEGNTEEALDCFRRAAKADPTHLESRFNVGSLLLSDGQVEEALPWLREAVDLKPDEELPQYRLADALLLGGDLEEARRRYELIVRMFPASPLACIQLARISLADSQPGEAVAWLRNAWLRGGEPVRQAVAQDPDFESLDLEAVFSSGE